MLWLNAASGVSARGAAQFNGTNQLLSAASNAALRAGGTDFFIATWAWIDTMGVRTFACKQPTPADREWILGYDSTGTFASNRFFFRTAGTGTANSVVSNSFGAAATGQWYFVIAWRDYAADKIRLRINAAASDENTPTNSITPTDAPLLLGASQASSPPTYDRLHAGRLDQVIFGKPVSISAVIANLHATLYNGGAGVSYSQLTAAQKADWGLVSFWELDERSGERRDAHGSNHLTPINNPVAADGSISGPADNLDPVQSWVDQIASIRMTQDTVSQRPTWQSAGTLDFDGIDDRLNRAAPIVGNRENFTLLGKLRLNALPTTNPAVVFTEADAVASIVNRLAVTPTGHVVASYRPAGGTLVTTSSSVTITPGVDVVVGVRRQGTALQVFVDGTPSGAAATINPGTSLDGATMRIGGPVESTGQAHFGGRIASLFAVGQALSDTDVAGLSSNL
ncbi:LamG-like jellyroll fold domain-containing protein [Tautonia rosea]|uniref:LamG-like jellyroll fold domain-containing protein n=1 Tax=Tautonia rosea TaxID=2728037 RepID=UPI001602EC82|nr:LamG-like jellyroll fold domain-containing protein [Tautonia rosea]